MNIWKMIDVKKLHLKIISEKYLETQQKLETFITKILKQFSYLKKTKKEKEKENTF